MTGDDWRTRASCKWCLRAGRRAGTNLPAYFIDARHANATGMTIVSSCPLLQEKQFGDSEYKHYIQHLCAPLDKILHEAKIDWLRYENSFEKRAWYHKMPLLFHTLLTRST